MTKSELQNREMEEWNLYAVASRDQCVDENGKFCYHLYERRQQSLFYGPTGDLCTTGEQEGRSFPPQERGMR